HALIDHLRRTVDAPASDTELLRRFVRDRDADAFELLVRRHERMVLGVCRRVLRDDHDAEDAFQATFLVLARKAHSVEGGGLAGWLSRVAYRAAVRARLRRVRRAARERQTARPEAVALDPSAEAVWRDLRPILDDEVNALPEK